MLTYFWREMICPHHVRLAAQLAASRTGWGQLRRAAGHESAREGRRSVRRRASGLRQTYWRNRSRARSGSSPRASAPPAAAPSTPCAHQTCQCVGIGRVDVFMFYFEVCSARWLARARQQRPQARARAPLPIVVALADRCRAQTGNTHRRVGELRHV